MSDHNRSAVTRVFAIPELLEQILFLDLDIVDGRSNYISEDSREVSWPELDNATWTRITQLCNVSKGWCAIIEGSPILGRMVFRHPETSTNIRIEGVKICSPFLWALSNMVRKLTEIRKKSDDIDAIQPFEAFTTEIATSNRTSRIPSLADYIYTGTYITQPAVKIAYLRFSGRADATWLSECQDFVRPEDYSSIGGFNYTYHYRVVNPSGSGVTAEDVVGALLSAICAFFSFKGDFENRAIDLSVGNHFMSNGKEYFSVVLSRHIWTPSPFQIRDSNGSILTRSANPPPPEPSPSLWRRLSNIL